MLVLRLRRSLYELQLGQNKHRLNTILQSRTTLIVSYIFYRIPQMEVRQTPFMLPRCLEAHATSSHKNGDRAPCNHPSIRQHPLTPATAPGSSAVPCSECTHAHKTPASCRTSISTSDDRVPVRFTSRAIPPATLAHKEEEWNGTDGPNNKVQTGDLQMPIAPCSIQPKSRMPYVLRYPR